VESKATIIRTLEGKVISDKMDKTIIVAISRTVKHPKYGKIMKRQSKIMAHDEKQISKIGDVVRITQTRPISKNKAWTLDEVLSS
jgi:small subunit ribosomal protein S17